jgi:hypothetical protein
MLCLKIPNSSKSQVKLLRAPKELVINWLKRSVLCRCSRIVQALLEAVERNFLRHFHTLYNTLALVRLEASRVQIELKFIAIDNP